MRKPSGNSLHAEAVQACERAVELDRESFLACRCLHLSLHLSGRFEEAVVVGESSLGMSGRHPWAAMSLAETFADWGNLQTPRLSTPSWWRARGAVLSNRPHSLSLQLRPGIEEEGISHAREALRVRDPILPLFFSRCWPHSVRLRTYPRFSDILAGARMEWKVVAPACRKPSVAPSCNSFRIRTYRKALRVSYQLLSCATCRHYPLPTTPVPD
jgi:hypothetical protein